MIDGRVTVSGRMTRSVHVSDAASTEPAVGFTKVTCNVSVALTRMFTTPTPAVLVGFCQKTISPTRRPVTVVDCSAVVTVATDAGLKVTCTMKRFRTLPRGIRLLMWFPLLENRDRSPDPHYAPYTTTPHSGRTTLIPYKTSKRARKLSVVASYWRTKRRLRPSMLAR